MPYNDTAELHLPPETPMRPRASLTMDTTLVRSHDVMHQSIAGETVLLDLNSETYFSLNETGTRVWHLLEQPASLASIHGTLCSEFDASASTIEADLLELGSRLIDAGLLDISI